MIYIIFKDHPVAGRGKEIHRFSAEYWDDMDKEKKRSYTSDPNLYPRWVIENWVYH